MLRHATKRSREFYDAWRQAIRPLQLAGAEASIKLACSKVLDFRFLVGVDTAETDPARFQRVWEAMGVPDEALSEVRGLLPRANQVLFGFEGNGEQTVWKVYLEFWNEIVDAVRRSPDDRSLRALHIGYKWWAARPERPRRATYTCHPLLSVSGIRSRMSALLSDRDAGVSITTARAILDRAAQRIVRDSFVYVEVAEVASPRTSFDLNLYKAGMRVSDVADCLDEAFAAYGCPGPSPFTDRELAGCPLGHLAGGRGPAGNDFLTVYFEIERLPD